MQDRFRDHSTAPYSDDWPCARGLNDPAGWMRHLSHWLSLQGDSLGECRPRRGGHRSARTRWCCGRGCLGRGFAIGNLSSFRGSAKARNPKVCIRTCGRKRPSRWKRSYRSGGHRGGGTRSFWQVLWPKKPAGHMPCEGAETSKEESVTRRVRV